MTYEDIAITFPIEEPYDILEDLRERFLMCKNDFCKERLRFMIDYFECLSIDKDNI